MYEIETEPCLRSGSYSLREMYRVGILFRNAKAFTEKTALSEDVIDAYRRRKYLLYKQSSCLGLGNGRLYIKF
jgi:hypothetical protein